jgi:hypothetical protein
LREEAGWDATPYQWATAGYMGAINSGKTICGILFGGSIYIGFLNGIDSTDAPKLKDKRRLNAIKSVNELFNGFINRFAETDCNALTGCDWSKKDDISRYSKCSHTAVYAESNDFLINSRLVFGRDLRF